MRDHASTMIMGALVVLILIATILAGTNARERCLAAGHTWAEGSQGYLCIENSDDHPPEAP